jgi:hypothetical protein
MSQLLNGPHKYWLVGGVLLGLLGGYVASDYLVERKLRDAKGNAARLEERAARMDQLEEKQAWDRVERAAEALLKYDLRDDPGRELQDQFRREFYSWKSRYGYPQLGSAR